MATRWKAVSAVAIAFALIATPHAVQDRPLRMRIVVQDLAGLSPTAITQSEIVVSRIYAQINVEISWRNIVGFEQTTAFDQTDEVVRCESAIHVALLSAETEHRIRPDRGTLGMAVAGTRLVRVFVGRVENVARGVQQDLGDVLGHAIAHETGHLLLGPGAHSTAGLMAARLDLPRIALGGLRFDQVQTAIIRAKLASDCAPRRGCLSDCA